MSEIDVQPTLTFVLFLNLRTIYVFVYNISIFLSNKLLFILHLELQKQCVSLTRRIFNTINNFSYTAYHRFCPRIILFLWSIQPFYRCNILFFAPVSQFLPLFLDFLPPFYLSCRFSSHLAPALFWASCVFDHRIPNFLECFFFVYFCNKITLNLLSFSPLPLVCVGLIL